MGNDASGTIVGPSPPDCSAGRSEPGLNYPKAGAFGYDAISDAIIERAWEA